MRKIGISATKLVKNYDKCDIPFLGSCFGHYDIAIEIIGESARVLSDCACNIQERTERYLIRSRGKKKGIGSVCSSLVISNEIICKGLSKRASRKMFPIRAYTFMRPFLKTDLRVLVTALSKKSTLYWNPSIFNVMMVTRGSSYNNVFKRILEYRSQTKRQIAESSSFFSLGFDSRFGISGDIRENQGGVVTAAVTMKLRSQVSSGRLARLLKKSAGNWRPLLADDFHPVFRRAGGSDYVLGITTSSLSELRKRTFELREELRGKIDTSTVLLLPGGDDE